MSTGAKVKVRRLEKGLTQVEFARNVGVTPRAVQRWESGERVLYDVRVLARAALVLDCRIEDLIDLE